MAIIISRPEQVAASILFACLRSQDIMAEFLKADFKDHPSVSLEYIKFLSHNSPFELVETLEAKFKNLDTEFKAQKKDNAAHVKQLNTITQKVEDGKSKIANHETRISKLEKKKD